MLNNICKVCGSDKVEIIFGAIYEYKGKTITIDNQKIYHCNNCKYEVSDEESWKETEKILEKFKNAINEGKV